MSEQSTVIIRDVIAATRASATADAAAVARRHLNSLDAHFAASCLRAAARATAYFQPGRRPVASDTEASAALAWLTREHSPITALPMGGNEVQLDRATIYLFASWLAEHATTRTRIGRALRAAIRGGCIPFAWNHVMLTVKDAEVEYRVMFGLPHGTAPHSLLAVHRHSWENQSPLYSTAVDATAGALRAARNRVLSIACVGDHMRAHLPDGCTVSRATGRDHLTVYWHGQRLGLWVTSPEPDVAAIFRRDGAGPEASAALALWLCDQGRIGVSARKRWLLNQLCEAYGALPSITHTLRAADDDLLSPTYAMRPGAATPVATVFVDGPGMLEVHIQGQPLTRIPNSWKEVQALAAHINN